MSKAEEALNPNFPVEASAPPPPSYSDFTSQNGFAYYPKVEELPSYFAFDSVPDTYILTPQTCPSWQPSNVKFERENDGDIKSFDKSLDYSKEELWKFFLTHLNPPRVFIAARGYHHETRHHTVYTKDADGRTHSSVRTETITVEDFNFSIDISSFVQKQWSALVVVPEKDGSYRVFSEVLDSYASSENKLKQIILRKQLDWDVQGAINMVYNVIRMTGYHHEVSVTMKLGADKIKVYSSSAISSLANNTCVRVMCFLTCLWIIFMPTYLIARKNIDNKIVCKFQMVISVEELYRRNYHVIYATVVSRSKNRLWQG